jgi:hypothetical protein
MRRWPFHQTQGSPVWTGGCQWLAARPGTDVLELHRSSPPASLADLPSYPTVAQALSQAGAATLPNGARLGIQETRKGVDKYETRVVRCSKWVCYRISDQGVGIPQSLFFEMLFSHFMSPQFCVGALYRVKMAARERHFAGCWRMPATNPVLQLLLSY